MKASNVTKTKSKKLTSASKSAKGKVGGISKAPKTAIPKAQNGAVVKKPNFTPPPNPYIKKPTPQNPSGDTVAPKSKAKNISVDKPYERGMVGAGNSATKTSSTMSGGTKTKKVSAGPVTPTAKGSITKTKTDSKGNMVKTSTKSISRDRANRMINRMSKKA